MPTYNYKCLDCNKPFEIFIAYKDYGSKAVLCPYCQSEHVIRRVNRIRIAHSTESRLEDYSDPAMFDKLEDDPKAIGRMMREMSKETGEDMGPEFDDVVGRLESGQTPKEIEKELPDFDGPDDASGGMGGDLDGLE